MRILVVSHYFWPENFRINEVAESLKGIGCEIVVLTGQPNYPKGVVFDGYSMLSVRTDEYRGIRMHRVPLIPRGRGSGIRLALNYLSFVVFASIIGPWHLRGKKIDVVLVHGMSPILQAIPGIWLARLKGARVVTWVQDLWPESLSVTGFVRSPRVLAAVSRVVRWIYRHNDLLLVQSRAFVEPVGRLAGRTPVEYHPNPGELAFADARETGPPALTLSPGFNVVFAGNLGTVQSLGTILEAAELLADLPDVRFVLVGSGSRDEWLAGRSFAPPPRERAAGRPLSAGCDAGDSVAGVRSAGDPRSRSDHGPDDPQQGPGVPRGGQADTRGAGWRRCSGGARCRRRHGVLRGGLTRACRRSATVARDERIGDVCDGRGGPVYYQRHFEPAALARRLANRLEHLVRESPGPGALPPGE